MLFAVFDNETTGLPFHRDADIRQQPRIIEFAGIITDGHEILAEEEFICDPGIEIEPIITEITGLTNADLRGQPPFKTFQPRVQEFFAKAGAAVAHNLSFDKYMLMYDLKRIGLGLSDISWPEMEICTVEQSFHRYGRRMKLVELHNILVGEYKQSHRALADVMSLHEVTRALGVYDALEEEFA